MPALPPQGVEDDVRRALREDLGDGDRTAALIPSDAVLETRVVCRDEAVLAGVPWFDETFRRTGPETVVNWLVNDGDVMAPGQEVCRLNGDARAILSGERTALNFLQTLSGTATRARQFVEAVEGTGAVILDTRKTVPGLRMAQKYAVRCGGASNHRIGLFDAVLIKENHIASAGSITAVVDEALRLHPGLLLEVEVENLEQLEEACIAGAQRVLLDNFSTDQLESAVKRYKGRIGLEASGGISLETVRAVALTGIDFISTGEITKHVHAVDFSMRFL